jgi:predicted nucleic acid-binding Zn ribbon protein
MVKKCPECGGKVEQMISAPAVQFKGSGWYVTDYAKKSSGSSSKSESSDGKSDKGEKSDKSGKTDSGKDSESKKESKPKTESTSKSTDKK